MKTKRVIRATLKKLKKAASTADKKKDKAEVAEKKATALKKDATKEESRVNDFFSSFNKTVSEGLGLSSKAEPPSKTISESSNVVKPTTEESNDQPSEIQIESEAKPETQTESEAKTETELEAKPEEDLSKIETSDISTQEDAKIESESEESKKEA